MCARKDKHRGFIAWHSERGGWGESEGERERERERLNFARTSVSFDTREKLFVRMLFIYFY
jgi:hypothetical protein